MALNIVVFSSGSGSNFQAIIDHIRDKSLDAKILAFICDNPQARAIERARANQIPAYLFDAKKYPTREDYDLDIKKTIDSLKPDLIILAGYLKIIKSSELLSAYRHRILNIHPSLLPAFKGSTNAQEEAFNHGCKVAGLTIHFVTEDVDGGQIIYQEAVDISNCNSAEQVREKILKCEHRAFSTVIQMFNDCNFRIDGRRVIFEKK